MAEEKTYRAVLRDFAQVVVGELLEETETTVTLGSPALMGVMPNGQSINLQFIPLDLASINPPISLAIFCKEGEYNGVEKITYKKEDLIIDDIPFGDKIFEGYLSSLEPKSDIVVPPNAGGLVGPDGSPLDATPPKAQDLF